MRREGRGEGLSRGADRAAIEDRGDRGSRFGEKASPRGVASLGVRMVRCLEGWMPKERVLDPQERILEDRGWFAGGAWVRLGGGSLSAGRGSWVAATRRGGGSDGMPCHWRKVVVDGKGGKEKEETAAISGGFLSCGLSAD